MSEKRLKVLQLGKLYYPVTGGIEKTMQQIAEGIKDNVDSCVLAAQPKGKAYGAIVNGVKVYYAKSWGTVASLPISIDLVRYLCRHAKEYDVIHLHVPFPLGDLACLLSGYKGKLIVYWHSDIVRQKQFLLLYKPLMKWLLKRADVILAATEGNIIGSKWIRPYKWKCRTVPFGLSKNIEKSSDRFWLLQQNEKIIRQSIEKQNGGLKLLFIGRLVYYKGCDVLIKAIDLLGEQDIEVVIVGTGILEQELKRYVDDKKIKCNITFMGFVEEDDLCVMIEECDVFVFPSTENSEAFGLVQLEAMAYGKPVINTSLPTGVPWVSLNGVTGLTVSPGNVQELADAILWMKYHPVERIEMGKRAREWVKKEFTEEKMNQSLLEIYKEDL